MSNDDKFKIFPLKLESKLHKQLKFKAIEEDKTLHEYIVVILEKAVKKTGS